MGKVCLFVICMYCSIHHLSAQQEEQQTQPVQQPLVTQDDILGNMNVDYAKIKLPPLSVLYENARSTPSLQILEKEKQLQKKLLSKEKRNWLGFIHAGGSASYGIADNVASNTDVNTPLIYRYVGTEQTSWNVGGGISIPFEKLFDLRGGIKRQRIQVDIAELRKQEAYETLKIQIAHLYVQILSNIETLQRSAENIALYKGASAVAEQEYRNRRTSIHDVAKTKEQEFAANQDFALLRSTINDQLLTLEIISHTPILTIQGEKDVQETTIQEQEENKKQSKKKDKKEDPLPISTSELPPAQKARINYLDKLKAALETIKELNNPDTVAQIHRLDEAEDATDDTRILPIVLNISMETTALKNAIQQSDGDFDAGIDPVYGHHRGNKYEDGYIHGSSWDDDDT